MLEHDSAGGKNSGAASTHQRNSSLEDAKSEFARRGMISAKTIAELEARRLLYVLGVRERTDRLVRELVLDDPAPFVPFTLARRRNEVDYEAKAVTLAGRRYIVCRNVDEMKKDAAARATIVAAPTANASMSPAVRPLWSMTASPPERP